MMLMNPIALRALRSLWCLTVCVAALTWSVSAKAACPDGDPCETLHVYRLQASLPITHDALGRPLASLQEANAADEIAFGPILSSSAKSSALAIRYRVTRIANNPNDYCECNLEYQGKGCPSSLPPPTLQRCARVCRYGSAECTVAGFNVKTGGGRWYAFPAATQCGGSRNVWQKRVSGRTNPAWCDWIEQASIVKQASCLAAELKQSPQQSLDALFDDDTACPRL